MDSDEFKEYVLLAQAGDPAFAKISREACVQAARAHYRMTWQAIHRHHDSGESGANVLLLLSEAADTMLRGAVAFGLYHVPDQNALPTRISVCALGGYGRAELSPKSDLDVCLLYSRRLTQDGKAFNNALMTFLWDMGFQIGYALHGVSEATKLAKADPAVYTTYAQARLITGSSAPFARLQQQFAELHPRDVSAILNHLRMREDATTLPEPHRDLYSPEPNIKENVGGLRDYHTALWLSQLSHGAANLEDLEELGQISSEEHLELVEALDVIWRIRNEMHFFTGKAEDQLTFALQRHVAQAFGYGGPSHEAVDRLMQDYYAAAQRIRWLLQSALRFSDQHTQMEIDFAGRSRPSRSKYTVYRGRLCAGAMDGKWFAERPARLMELMWECARRRVPLSYSLVCWVVDNLHLVHEAFRTSDVVRRYFTAICSRPLAAGLALREAAKTGLLGAYLPEFGAIQGIVRYEDFHSYPVDEHTLRAVEAIALIPRLEGAIANVLRRTLEHVRDPHLFIMAILLHDLGKASGESHVAEGVRVARAIGTRIGLTQEETGRIAFLVKHHMLMSTIALYRDTDDMNIVNTFAETMKTDERLRELLLLTYADLSAVAPNVWNDWKGALLLKLFLKAERILLGRADIMAEEDYWKLPKAEEVRACVPEALKPKVGQYLRSLGERYLIAFAPDYIARHMVCCEEAQETGLALRCDTHEETAMSEVVVCTRDRHGLFAAMAGSFASQLVDVESAALFTSLDGYVVDCFAVKDASTGRPLTANQFKAVKRVMQEVLIEGKDITHYVEESRRRLFALLQPRVPLRTRIDFDNDSSVTDTVIDIETGDRTGLLYDISTALAAMGVDIRSARIMTDARRVRDAFYVRLDNAKLQDHALLASVREGLEQAIHPKKAADE